MALKILSFLKLFYFLRYQIFFLFFTFNHLYLFAEVKIIDADTIYLNGDKVRLSGIDAPETAQTCLDDNKEIYLCGKKARQKLIQQIWEIYWKLLGGRYFNQFMVGRKWMGFSLQTI